MRYLKISLILTCICLLCALGVAGVNYVTAPIIEKNELEARMAAYEQIFPELSVDNSVLSSDGFKSSYVKDKIEAKDANGNALGFGFQVGGQNTYGPISLVVGINPDGNLIDVIIIENGQTGGRNVMINSYVDSFEAGMTVEEVDSKPNYATATYGSTLVKDLIKAAFAETGIMTEIQKKLVAIFGESVDMGKSIVDDTFIYPQQINLGYTVKDGNDTVLGYYYEVNATNQYGNISLGVALDTNYSLKDLETFEVIQTGGRDESVNEFIGNIQTGSDYDTINDLDVISKATYGCNTVKNAIMIAMSEAKNVFDEELAIRTMFPTFTRTEALEATVTNVEKYLEVYANGRNGETKVGSVVVSTGSNNYGDIKLFIGLNTSGALSSVFIMEASQTAGRNKSLSDFIGGKITSGMTGEEVLSADVVSGATFASNTAKEIIANAFEQVTGTRPQLGYDEQYASLFEGVDVSKSKDFNLEGLDEQFTEGKELYSADGTLLGYGFVLTSTPNKYDGTLTLMVGVQTNGKLQKVIMLANNQTGGFGSNLDGYEDQFTPGMSVSDVDGVANTGATLGSEQFKELVKLALSAVKTYDDFYLQAFEGVDLTKSVAIETFSNKQILEGKELYNASNELLGKAYILRLENAYGYNIMLVSVKADGTLGKLVDVENNHADLNKVAGFFPEGTTLDKISECVDNNWGTEAGGSYTVEIAALGIKIALAEASTGVNDSVYYEALAKEIFPYMVMKHSTVLTTFTNVSYEYNGAQASVVYGIKVNGTKNYVDESEIGYAYVVELSNGDITFRVMIGVSVEGTVVGSKLISYETINCVDPSALGDNLQGKVESYLEAFNGLTLSQINGVVEADTAYYASRLVKLGFMIALNEVSEVAVSGYDVWNDENAYKLALYNVNLLKSKVVETTNPNIKSILEAYDSNGTKLGYIYIVDVLGIYSHNYIMVVLSADGTKLAKLVDLENNHGALASVESLFPAGLTLAKLENIKFDSISGASFSIEQVKLAVKIAMVEQAQSDNTSVVYETAAKNIFPYMVATRSQNVENIVDSAITYGLKVYGISYFTPGQFLGYVYVVTVNSLKVMIGVDTDGNYYGYEVLSGSTTAIQDFFKDTAKGTTLEQAQALTGDADAKSALVKVLTEAQLHLNLTEYDETILMAFPTYDIKLSALLENYRNEETLAGILVKDSQGSELGKAYVVKITNVYSWHIFVVALDNENKLIDVLDYDNYHESDGQKADISEQLAVFTSGMDLATIENIKYDVIAEASFTIEQIRLGILVAMNEANNVDSDSLRNEIVVKELFPNAIWGRSEELSNFTSTNVLFGMKVYSSALSNVTWQPLGNVGYVYIVRVENMYSWHIFGVALDMEGKLIKVIDVDNYHPADGEKADISAQLEVFTPGLDLAGIENIGYDAVSHASFTIEQIRLGIKIAMSEFASTYSDNLKYEMAVKTIFNTAIWDRSTLLSNFTSTNVLFGMKVYSSGFDASFKPLENVGYAFVVSKDNLKVMIGLNMDNSVVSCVVLEGEADMSSFAGKTKAEVEAMSDSLAKDLVLIALAEGGNQ